MDWAYLLGLVALIVLLAASGATYEAIMRAGDARRYPPQGQLVDVGGHRLHLHCVGQGSPTVVLDAGLGPGPRSPRQFADELHTFLTNAGIQGPYVLVSHSMSGKTARLFTSQHPNDVAGIVLIDTRHESVDEHSTPQQLAAEDTQQQRFKEMIKWTARFALVRLLWSPAWPRVLPGTENLSPDTRTTIGVLHARPVGSRLLSLKARAD